MRSVGGAREGEQSMNSCMSPDEFRQLMDAIYYLASVIRIGAFGIILIWLNLWRYNR